MANTRFQHKRSTVSGVTPTTGDIAAGELGLNLADRRIFTSNGTAVFELGSNLASLSVSGNAVIIGSANAANVTAALFTGNVTGTASNATNLNSQPGSFYTNATNLTTGTLNNARLPSTISVSAVNASTFGIGSAISLFSQGANGFSVNENFSVGNNSITGYHFTSGAGRSSVVFTLARSGVFTSGFGVTGNTSNNDFIIGGEFSNTNLIFKTGLGMPFNVAGGTVRFTVANSGLVTLTNNLHAGNSTSNLQLSNTTLVISNSTSTTTVGLGDLRIGNTTVNTQHSSATILISNSTTSTTVGLTDIRLGNSTVNTFINASGFTTAANVLINSTGELVISPGAGIFANGSLGTTGQVLSSNGTSVYWASAATSAAGVLQAVASGSLSDGTRVIINANGTVSAVGFVPGAPTFGSKVVYKTGPSGTDRVVVYDSFNQKVVVSAFNQVWVGTVSGSSITFGSPVTLPTVGGNNLAVRAAAYHANAQKIVFLCDVSGTSIGYGVVGTVSGSSISFGTPASFDPNAIANLRYAVYDTVNQVVVFSYSISSANQCQVQAAAISGTDVSFGDRVSVFNSNRLVALSYDINAQKVVAAFVGASNFGQARVCTVSGTSISLGTAVTFNSAATSDITIVYDPNSQNHVIAFRDSNSFATARTATVSGTGFSFFGNKLALNSIETFFSSAVYDSFAGRCVLFGLTNFSNSFAFVVSVSGTTITLNHAEIFNNGSATAFAAFDASANRVVLAYADPVNSQADTSRVMETAPSVTNLTAANFIGISSGAYSAGQTAAIQTVGSVDDAQSGLTAGQAYYVQANGALSITPDVPVVFAGTAVTANNLLIAKTLESLTVGTGASVRQTNATIINPTITNYTETLANAGSVVTAYAVDLSLGTIHRVTTTNNLTVTLPASVAGKSFVVMVNYGGTHSLTWTGGGTLRWAGGTIPTATSVNGKIDVFSFFQDGTNTFGAVIGSNF
jgi:hypothetical protein